MGLFFKTRDNAKRTKLNLVLNIITVLAMVILLIMALFNELDPFFFMLICIVAAISSIIDGVESYILKENRRVYLLDFGYALVWFVLSFFYSS